MIKPHGKADNAQVANLVAFISVDCGSVLAQSLFCVKRQNRRTQDANFNEVVSFFF